MKMPKLSRRPTVPTPALGVNYLRPGHAPHLPPARTDAVTQLGVLEVHEEVAVETAEFVKLGPWNQHGGPRHPIDDPWFVVLGAIGDQEPARPPIARKHPGQW